MHHTSIKFPIKKLIREPTDLNMFKISLELIEMFKGTRETNKPTHPPT